MTIAFPELNIKSDAIPLGSLSGDTSESTFVSADFTVPNGVPELWYTHNLGIPKLYNVTVTWSHRTSASLRPLASEPSFLSNRPYLKPR